MANVTENVGHNSNNRDSTHDFPKDTLASDICIKLLTTDIATGIKKEENIFAHSFILMASSPYLRNLINLSMLENIAIMSPIPTVELNFGKVPDAIPAFKSILHYLYTGDLVLNSLKPVQVLKIAQLCQITTLEIYLSTLITQNTLEPRSSKMSLNCNVLSLPYFGTQFLLDLNMLLAIRALHTNTAILPQPTSFYCSMPRTPSILYDRDLNSIAIRESLTHTYKAHNNVNINSNDGAPQPIETPTTSNDSTNAALASNLSGVIVPSSDKEGWCRNKKYIERVLNGFRCTVCHKIYGRYNSVSYHVTIYHRNPPIRCDESGCQFTTREARYIHFHKYYRHHIPLPETIDLGSRKCPFCRHVSKSPAMLEKHINRHIPNEARSFQQYKISDDSRSKESQRKIQQSKIYEHLTSCTEFHKCEHCSYRGQTSNNLNQHQLFKHNAVMFKKRLNCVECKFCCTSRKCLLIHYDRMHRNNSTSENEALNSKKYDETPIIPKKDSEMQKEPMCLVKQKAGSVHE